MTISLPKILLTSCLAAIILTPSCSILSKKKKDDIVKTAADKSKSKDDLKPYSEVITDKAETDSGLFQVHKVGEKYYFEIPDSLFGREMIMVTRISRSADELGYGGEQLGDKVLRWQKLNKKTVLLRSIAYNNIADTASEMYQSVRNSNMQPILASLDIKALNKDSTAVVIDVTDLFNKDNKVFSFSQSSRKEYKLGGQDNDRSFIKHVNSYPKNIEIRTVKTYSISEYDAGRDIPAITVEINNSMLLLPKEPMQPRLYDARVGFFAQSQTDYSLDAQKAKRTVYVRRWQLVPKDIDAYMQGELVEPIKPIVYYIDPATPEKWRPYIKAGVEDWNKAFEAAGFKNAIICKYPPSAEEDPEFSTEDARYSVIRYFASNIPNAYGPHVADPRSGEIIESHIGWYHNVMNLLRNWYFVQTAAINPKARSAKFKDEVMGGLIRFVSSHEVGHTLGLRHNFGASHAYPVDSLRSVSFTRKYGTAPSIMDYARFNYIAQPGDEGVSLYPAIGPYDKWAIEWGYRYIPNAESPQEETPILNEWVKEHTDPIYFFGRENNSADPRSQNEDLGDDAVKASKYGIANLKIIIRNIEKWTYQEGQSFQDLEELYGEVMTQWGRYMGHVSKYIGGVYETPKTYDQQGDVYRPVSKEKQQRALNFLIKEAFETPSWLVEQPSVRKFNQSGMVENLSARQARVLASVLSISKMERLIEYDTFSDKAYSLSDFFNDLRKGVWSEVYSGKPTDTYRRNLQKAYVERLAMLITPPSEEDLRRGVDDHTLTDIGAMAFAELQTLGQLTRRAKSRFSDKDTRAHFTFLNAEIERLLKRD